MNGYLLIDKPKSWTSFDVVNKIRHLIQNSGLNTTGKKRFPVGHTGTLDPLATGLLVVLLGDYTKRAPELTKLDKTYEAIMKLGETSTTGDEEGNKTVKSSLEPDFDMITEICDSFKGEIEQTPPIFSAIKVNGKKAYELARKGEVVKLEPRLAKIYTLGVIDYNYPYVRFTTRVSSGTYIRTLIEDIGAKLQTGAYMSDLHRTKVGDFDISDAMTMENISAEMIYKVIKTI